jgi:hypothetical protein
MDAALRVSPAPLISGTAEPEEFDPEQFFYRVEDPKKENGVQHEPGYESYRAGDTGECDDRVCDHIGNDDRTEDAGKKGHPFSGSSEIHNLCMPLNLLKKLPASGKRKVAEALSMAPT